MNKWIFFASFIWPFLLIPFRTHTMNTAMDIDPVKELCYFAGRQAVSATQWASQRINARHIKGLCLMTTACAAGYIAYCMFQDSVWDTLLLKLGQDINALQAKDPYCLYSSQAASLYDQIDQKYKTPALTDLLNQFGHQYGQIALTIEQDNDLVAISRLYIKISLEINQKRF